MTTDYESGLDAVTGRALLDAYLAEYPDFVGTDQYDWKPVDFVRDLAGPDAVSIAPYTRRGTPVGVNVRLADGTYRSWISVDTVEEIG